MPPSRLAAARGKVTKPAAPAAGGKKFSDHNSSWLQPASKKRSLFEEEEEEEEEEEGEGEGEGEAPSSGSKRQKGDDGNAVPETPRPDMEVPGWLRISTLPKLPRIPRKPIVASGEGKSGFNEFKRSKQYSKNASVAAKEAAETAREEEERRAAEEAAKKNKRKRKAAAKNTEQDLTARLEAAAATAARKARKELHQSIVDEWNAMEGDVQQKWADKEGELMKAYESATEGGGTPMAAPTSYKLKLREPVLAEKLLRIPSDGFKAFSKMTVGGLWEQKAWLKSLNVEYDVEKEMITVEQCTVVF